MRTAKSCGPDAPTLASSWRRQLRRRRWQTSPVTGESSKETVKTIAQGRPGVSGEPVVTNSCAFYLCTRGRGCNGHPAFPAPSEFRRRNVLAKLAWMTRRECEAVAAAIVIACDKREAFAQGSGSDEAIHSFFPCGTMDCFANARNDGADCFAALAMTVSASWLFEIRIGNWARSGLAVVTPPLCRSLSQTCASAPQNRTTFRR